ncbi:MAG: glycosyltransferase family 87 protein [Sphingomicrobium sp.]
MGAISTGSWLSRERARRIALVAGLVSIAVLAFLIGASSGTLDYLGRPIGTDFSQVWTAGRMALDGQAADVWNWDKHFVVQRALHGPRLVEYYGWHYPPPFLLLAAALATLPYLPALALWQTATLIPFAALIRRMTGRVEAWLFVLAAPVSLICVMHGHNGFLTALLLGGGLLALERRPFVAGLLLGCLVYKPQFALVLPLLLLVTGNWRAIAGAAISSLGLIALSYGIWGWPVWQAFIDSLPLTRRVVIEAGSTGWEKIMSPFSAIRSWGGGIGVAYVVQAITSVIAIGASLWMARAARPDLRNAAVTATVLIATPYVLDYDFVVLLAGIAFLWRDAVRHGWLPWEKTLLGLVWIAPLVARNLAALTLVPVGLMTAIIILGLAVQRALTASPSRHSHAASGQ